MKRLIAVAAAALLLTIVTGCNSGSSDVSSVASSTPASGTALSAEWIPKLETATTAETAICNQVGDQACAEYLTEIAMVVGELGRAITEAGGSDIYPRSSTEVEKVNTAVEAYSDHECLGDENAGIEGSPCPDDAYAIMLGGAALKLTLETGEAKNGS